MDSKNCAHRNLPLWHDCASDRGIKGGKRPAGSGSIGTLNGENGHISDPRKTGQGQIRHIGPRRRGCRPASQPDAEGYRLARPFAAAGLCAPFADPGAGVFWQWHGPRALPARRCRRLRLAARSARGVGFGVGGAGNPDRRASENRADRPECRPRTTPSSPRTPPARTEWKYPETTPGAPRWAKVWCSRC